jgi:hypothetical protein
MNRTLRERFVKLFFLLLFLLFWVPAGVLADQVEMLNGDRYVGKIISLNTNTLVFQNEILGTVRLPCSKMARVTFGTNLITNGVPPAPASPSIAIDNVSNSIPKLTTNASIIKQVQDQTLGAESAEAKDVYNEMVAGLLTGKLTVNDIRNKAKAVADELRQYKRELGDEAGGALDGYLSILDHFIKETEPPAEGAPKAVAPSKK